MRSLTNQYTDLHTNNKSLCFYKNIKSFESMHYKMANLFREHVERHDQLQFEHDQLKLELNKLKKDDQKILTDISKKLNNVLKDQGEKELLIQLQLNRAKILDHFTLAYLSELDLKPSQIKLVQGVNDEGYVEMYFEKHSDLILPDHVK